MPTYNDIYRLDDEQVATKRRTGVNATAAPRDPRTVPPGGAYLVDQIDQAGQAIRQGNVAQGLGIGARGLVTSPLVAGYEVAERIGQDLGPMARSVGNFAAGLTGLNTLSTPAVAPGPRAPIAPGKRLSDPSTELAQQTPLNIDTAALNRPRPRVETVGQTTSIGPTMTQQQPVVAQPPANAVQASSIAALSPETSAALYQARLGAIDRGEANAGVNAGGYAPTAAYGTPGPGDFNQSALEFAARRGDARKVAAITQMMNIQAAIPRENALADSQIRNAGIMGRAQSGLMDAQAQDLGTRGRIALATLPGELARNQAQIGQIGALTDQSRAQTGEIGARTAQLGQQTEAGKLQLKRQQDLDAMRTKAITSGKPEDLNAYAQAVRADQGKGTGGLTDEDAAKIWGDYVVAFTKNPTAGDTKPMGFGEFRSQLRGTAPQTVSKADYQQMVKSVGSEEQVKKMLAAKGLTLEP